MSFIITERERLNMSEVILFDLDGTLTDSAEGITKSVQYALNHFGIEEPDLKNLECFVGPPLKEQFMKYCRFSEKQAEVAISVYRERYAKTGIYENKPYEGIESVLKLLKTKGKTLGVASSKPTVYVKRILEHFELDQYFEVVAGAELDGTRTDKAEVIEYALEMLGMQENRADVLMVGDRLHDVEGALHCGMQCIGVAYGYGGIYELETAGAVYIAQTVEDLKILAGNSRNEGISRKGRKRNDPSQPIRARLPQISPWMKIWRVLYPLGIHYGIMLALSLLASAIIVAWYGVYQGFDIETITSYQQEYALLITGVVSIIAIPILSLFYRKDCRMRERTYLRGQSVEKQEVTFGIYTATILLMISVSQIVNFLIDISPLYKLFPYYSDEVNAKIFAGQPILVTILVVVFLGPIAEEVLFRGLVFKRIQDYLGNGVGIVISALFFGIYHQNMIQFVYASILGLVLAFLMQRSNSIIVPIIGHIAANLWSVIGPGILKQIAGGNEYIYIGCMGVMGVACVLSTIYIIKVYEHSI